MDFILSMTTQGEPTMSSQEKVERVDESDDPERSDPAVNSDALPDDHPIHLLLEARELYGSEQIPPFVLKKKHQRHIRSVVIPTRNGLRPKDEKAVTVNLVAKPWDRTYVFWTLDLNGTRYIVKSSKGNGRGGKGYLYWAGPGKDFNPKPLALSTVVSSQQGTAISTKGDGMLAEWPSFPPFNHKRSIPTDTSDTSDSSDSSDSEVEEKGRRTPGLTQRVSDARPGSLFQHIDDNESDHYTNETNAIEQPVTFQSMRPERRKTDVSYRKIDQLYRVSPPTQRRSNAHASYKKRQAISPQQKNQRKLKRNQTLLARIEGALERTIDQIFTPWAGKDQIVSRHVLEEIMKAVSLMKDNSPQEISQTLNKALNGGDGKRQLAGGRKPIGRFFLRLVATLQSSKLASLNGSGLKTLSFPPGSNHQQEGPSGLQGLEAVGVEHTIPDTRQSPSKHDRHQLDQDLDLDVPPSMVLSRHKQTRTTLIVRVAPSLEYIPLKLSDCMTPEAFYPKVYGAWELHRESVAKMTVTFTWMDAKDSMRTMAMNSQVEGCFAHMIEQVDEAPVWAEAPEGRGKCILDVEIFVKEKSKRGGTRSGK